MPSTEHMPTQDEPDNADIDEEGGSPTSAFVMSLILGAFILATWIGAWTLYISRT